MKITIYELLGMIKDGNTPKRILYDNYIWSWTGDDYQTILKDKKEQFLITGMYYTWLTDFLNYPVEILEEEKKIPEKIRHDACWIYDDETNQLGKITLKDDLILNKLDEIIDYLKSKGDE